MVSTSRERFLGLALLLTACACSWLAMMAVHELGHVVNAWLSGGHVAHVVLHPLTMSRTDLSENPHPIFVAAGGAAWGVGLPLAAWLISRNLCPRCAFLLKFFAGFCLVANGAYLASAIVMPVGDSEDLLRLGAPMWTLVLPGIVALLIGLALWNGLGPHFGFGEQRIDRQALYAVMLSLVILITGMLLWSALGEHRRTHALEPPARDMSNPPTQKPQAQFSALARA